MHTFGVDVGCLEAWMYDSYVFIWAVSIWICLLIAQVPTRRGRPSTVTIPQLGNATYPSIRLSPWVTSKYTDYTLLTLLGTPLLGSVAADMDDKLTAKAKAASEAEAATSAATATAATSNSKDMPPPPPKTPTKKQTRGNGGIVAKSPLPVTGKSCGASCWLEDAANILDKALTLANERGGLTPYDELRCRAAHWQNALEFCLAGQALGSVILVCHDTAAPCIHDVSELV